jgi:4-amino-4-deoxy-L-arabinose transferase-like glycosyltransferase
MSRAVAAVLAGAAAFAFVAFATQPPGPGLDPDAVSYVGAAVSLVRSGTYRIPTSGWAASDTTEPLAHFPPGFSTAIAGPVALGVPPVQAARIVIAVSAFVTAAVVCTLMDTIGLGALAVVFLTPGVVDAHLSVLSEPLFIALLVATLATMVRVADRPEWIWRVALGVLAAGAVMVRYAGAGVVAAAALWVFAQPAPWRRRLRDLALVVLPSIVVLGLWVVHATARAGDTSIRRFAVYRHLAGSVLAGVRTVVNWLAPGLAAAGLPAVISWVIALAVALVVARTLVAALRAHRATILTRAAATLLVCSLVVIVASRVLADPNIPFDERLLAPSMLLAELAIVAALPSATRPARIVLGAWFLGSAIVSVAAVRAALDDGGDFASADWRFSPTVSWVRDSANGRALYTNWPIALYFYDGRDSHELPPVLEPLTLRRFGDRLARTHGLLVAFDATTAPDFARPDSIAARLRLRAVARFSDGTVWEVPGPMSADGRPKAASGSP